MRRLNYKFECLIQPQEDQNKHNSYHKGLSKDIT